LIDTIKIRIFGSDDCDNCNNLKKAFDIHSIGYEYVDAMSDETQSLCDKNKVDELPHIQAYVNEDDIFYNRIGFTSPLVIMQELIEAKENKDNPSDIDILGVRKTDIGPIVPKKPSKGCGGC